MSQKSNLIPLKTGFNLPRIAGSRRGRQAFDRFKRVVLELRPATGPPDISDVTLTAARPGAPAQSVSVDLSPTGAGQFFGTLKLAWTDSCRLEVALAR